jgi:hypothetical protein
MASSGCGKLCPNFAVAGDPSMPVVRFWYEILLPAENVAVLEE